MKWKLQKLIEIQIKMAPLLAKFNFPKLIFLIYYKVIILFYINSFSISNINNKPIYD